MNNIKYWNDSLAHDFDMFMPKEKKQNTDNVIPIPEIRKKAAAKPVSSFKSKAVTALIIAFIIGAFFGNIYIHAEISKVGAQISKVEAEAEELKSERTRLSVELEKKTSVGNLERKAEQLGMQKQTKAQTNYIFNYEDNTDYGEAGNE